MCVYMTLNTEGELWEEGRIMECTRDEQEDYLGKSRGGLSTNGGKCGREQEKGWHYLMSAMMLCRI